MKRDNSYILDRLKKDGRSDLLEMIESGTITVYRASVAAGYRKKKDAPSRADQIGYHYTRAAFAEKRRFIIENWSSVTSIVQKLAMQKREYEAAEKSHGEA